MTEDRIKYIINEVISDIKKVQGHLDFLITKVKHLKNRINQESENEQNNN